MSPPGLKIIKSFAVGSKAKFYSINYCTIILYKQLAVIPFTWFRPYSFAPFSLENFAYSINFIISWYYLIVNKIITFTTLFIT